MAEYWKRPEQTAETLKSGWLHTGDIARKPTSAATCSFSTARRT